MVVEDDSDMAEDFPEDEDGEYDVRVFSDGDVIPLPGEPESERRRIRKSNDRDQQAEQRGEQTRHNQGYDEAADGVSRPPTPEE